MSAPLTDELVFGLAPDSKATDLARELARSGAFDDLRRSPDGTWLSATCGSYAVRIDLAEADKVHTSCTCASYKRPCKHALGLLFFAVRSADRFDAEAPSASTRARVLAAAQAGKGSVSLRKSAGPANPTSVGEALFQNICAEPFDDAPRLIYADWLDEQGEAERAEFIRVQCALARMSADDEQAPALRQRQKALLTKTPIITEFGVG
jgi:uncharacterized protein (TIGR02996 family)